ncbi:MAG: right-handed parallel beta-helix repeat-containing protein [Parcubacteria group bacterium]|nr:right-handed parallel beta-helix repeat-containing protein [Parcubacteria group bacterium]
MILLFYLFYKVAQLTKVRSRFADEVELKRDLVEQDLKKWEEKTVIIEESQQTKQKNTIMKKVVAASDASLSSKNEADYITDGKNDEEEINKAIESLSSAGGIIYLTEGTFRLRGSISIRKSNIKLIGSSRFLTKLVLDPLANLSPITIGDDKNFYKNIIISSLEVDGNRLNQSSNQNGIHVYNNIKTVIIEKNYIHSNFLQGIGVSDNVWDIIIANNFVEDNPGEAISVSGKNCQIINNYARDGWDAIVLTAGSRNCIVQGNHREGEHWGILIYGNDHIINGNTIYRTNGGISIDGNWGGGKNIIISNNNLTENDYGIFLIHGPRDSLITNNAIKDSKCKSVREDLFWRTKNVKLKHNLITDNATKNSECGDTIKKFRLDRIKNSIISDLKGLY